MPNSLIKKSFNQTFLFLFFLFIFNLLTSKAWSEGAPRFRLHINTEPVSLNPLKQKSSSAAFLFTAVHAPMLWYENGKLFPWLGECQQLNPKKIICEINPKAKFSNGENIRAIHFIKTFRHFLDPKKPGFRANFLLGIKNAEKILSGQLPFDKLGASGEENKLVIELEKTDYEFIFNLANPILAPTFNDNVEDDFLSPQSAFSGPYQIKSWQPKQKIVLIPNSNYQNSKNIIHPGLEFYFIAEDSVALNLFQKKELDFLRRLPTLYISQFKNSPDYHAIDQLRFDYFGFGPSLKDQPEIRKTLAQSLNYDELQALFWSKPRPGCSGLPEYLLPKPSCIDEVKIIKELSKISSYQNLTMSYSKQGGDDVDRSSQWIQSQWKKNLGIQVQLSQMDNKIFLEQLRQTPPTIFHIGPAPSRPTCLSVLENFLPNSPENWIKLDSPVFNQLINKMKSTSNKKQKDLLCQKGMDFLIKGYYLIPTGPEYFSILVRPEWKDWHLNDLNQLNLTDLHFSK